MKWIIYKHTSPSGKSYIGQTRQLDVKLRWANGSGYKKHNTIFYKAIKKYGWNNFAHEIIEDNIQTQELANEREVYWIAYFDSFKNGYNSTPGGYNVGDNVASKPVLQIDANNPKNIIAKYKSAMEASRTTGICARNIGACCLKQGQITAGGYYWCFENNFSNFTPRIKRQGKTNLRKVYCFETDSVFNSIVEASNKLNIAKDGIYCCCKNKQATAGNCHFCYFEDKENYIFIDKKTKDKKQANYIINPIYQIEIKTLKILQEYNSISHAEKCTGISHQQIGKCVNKKYISAGGYYWCKKEEWFEDWIPPQRKSTKKAVYCLELNLVFKGLQEASLKTGIIASSINQVCNKKLITAGGFHWFFYDEILDKTYSILEHKSKRKIICIETREQFNSINEACKKYHLHNSNLSTCLKNSTLKTCGGFHWCYLEDYNAGFRIKKQRTSIMRPVKNLETKEVFDSIREASKQYSIFEQNIYRVCNKKAKSAGGYHWEYVDKDNKQ